MREGKLEQRLEESQECELHVIKQGNCPVCYSTEPLPSAQACGASHTLRCRPTNSNVLLNAFGYRINLAPFYSAHRRGTLSIKKKKNPFYSDSRAAPFKHNPTVIIQPGIHLNTPGPCATCLRIATIIDDRGEDCYA